MARYPGVRRIEYRHSASWSWRVRYGGNEYQRGGFATAKAAAAARAEFLRELQAGVSPEAITVGTYLTHWYEGHRHQLEDNAAETLWYQLRHVIEDPIVGRKRLSDVRLNDLGLLYGRLLEPVEIPVSATDEDRRALEMFEAGMTKTDIARHLGHAVSWSARAIRRAEAERRGDTTTRQLSRTYVRNIHTHLQLPFTMAVAQGYLMRNPMTGLKAPAQETRPTRPTWTLEEVKTFLAVANDHRLAAMWLMFITTGLRLGEMVGLRLEDVDLAHGEVRVGSQVTRDGRRKDPKTDTSMAPVPLDETTTEALQAWLEVRAAEAMGPDWTETGALFCRSDGSLLHHAWVRRELRRMAEWADVPPLTPHGLRHTCGAILAEAGVSMRWIQQLLRHAHHSTTADIYTRHTHVMGRQTADKMHELLGESSPTPEPPRGDNVVELAARRSPRTG